MESAKSGASTNAARGRRRDETIDERILSAARRQLACHGYEAMSLSSIAQEACTTRQALYRRWSDKALLASAAICAEVGRDALPVSDDPLADLVTELAAFQHAMSTPGQLSLVGTMLQDGTDATSRAEYGRRVIEPRLERMRSILEHARELNLIDEAADIELAVSLPTGAWYERTLAGLPAPDHWPARSAALIWRSVGGSVSPAPGPSARPAAPPNEPTGRRG